MKDILQIIRVNFILLAGTGLFAYGLFSFGGKTYCAPTRTASEFLYCNKYTTLYHYNDIALFLLAIGIILITIGLLKRNSK